MKGKRYSDVYTVQQLMYLTDQCDYLLEIMTGQNLINSSTPMHSIIWSLFRSNDFINKSKSFILCNLNKKS